MVFRRGAGEQNISVMDQPTLNSQKKDGEPKSAHLEIFFWEDLNLDICFP